MLTTYLTQTKQILQSPAAPTSLYSDADLTSWINRARLQLAGDSESIRIYATIPLTATARQYPFSLVNLGGAPGVAGIFNIRTLWYNVGSGQKWIRPRSFEWFSLYELNNPVPDSGAPLAWTQFGQGTTGSIFMAPIPDIAYTCPADVVGYPIDLVNDSTVEAIPKPWTDAVCYYTAYLAYLSAQSPARQADAQRMFDMYSEFMNRARRFSNPTVLPGQYAQAPNPTRMNQLGLQPARTGGG